MQVSYHYLTAAALSYLHLVDALVCNPGNFQLTQANNRTVCEPCQPGTYSSLRGASTCTPCPSGTYSPTAAANSSSKCIQCPLFSLSGTASTSIVNCTCNAGYTGTSGNCSICPAGTYKPLAGPAACTACNTGSNSTPGALQCFCLPGFQRGNNSVTPYDPGLFCITPSCPLNGTFTASTGLLCRLRYRNNEAASWIITPSTPHAGLLLTFLTFETELQHDFVAVYSCTALECCNPATADPPKPSCLRSTPVLVSGALRVDGAAPEDHCGAKPLLSSTTNPIKVFTS